MGRLKVAVRIRPLSQLELAAKSTPIVILENENAVTITNVKVPEQNAGDSRERIRRFTFDFCFDENSPQDEVFATVGKVVETAVRKHEHSCVLAYGQSSSGKTHTMMGLLEDPGITPRLCQNVLAYFQESATEHEAKEMKTTVSYLEIYNEKVRDLLTTNDDSCNPADGYKTLKVREHPKKGPYVQGLSEHPVFDSETLLHWLHTGNSKRKVAATTTNPQSSRSHSVFTITGCGGTKLHLIDLAGSERAGNRYSNTSRFREGANINKSLVALGNVISVLAEKSDKSSRNIRRFVPYRDSLLTWLLRDTLGGNSTTVMIATVSPSSTCYSETVNTLRFGQRAKQIILQPVVNEDPKERTIRELRAEILRLRELLLKSQNVTPTTEFPNTENNLVLLQNYSRLEEESVANQIEITTNSDNSVLKNLSVDNLNKSGSENNEHNSDNHDNSLNSTKGQFFNSNPSVITEKLLPLIEVSTKIGDKEFSITNQQSNLKLTELLMEKNPDKPFGSVESLPESKILKQKRVPLSRRSSTDKVGAKLKTSTLRSGSDPNAQIKKEKGILTEVKGPPPKRPVTKARSTIVAEVTNRLYAKVKKKEVSTETEQPSTSEKVSPKELKICSNARTKLQELTRRALTAHRKINEETQTDLFPVLRVKEMSTDVDDLKIALVELKDAETDTLEIVSKDVAVECSLIENFDIKGNFKNVFLITRSCGTQSNKEEEDKSTAKSTHVSFTKYLQEHIQPRFEIINPSTANPIYTSSVNINVSHNYINRTLDNTSDDSLEDQNLQSVCLPTPDLISNHNSLDAHTHANVNNDQPDETSVKTEERTSFATLSDSIPEKYAMNQNLEKNLPQEVCVANCTLIPDYTEQLKSIDIPKIYAPEVCVVKDPSENRCQPLIHLLPEYLKLKLIEESEAVRESVLSTDPVVLKSIMKQNLTKTKETVQDVVDHEESDPSSEEETVEELPDSLNYHKANTKRVKFADNKVESDHMLKAMSKFLGEATNLISTLTLAASKIENCRISLPEDYDIQVTVNDISGLSTSTNTSKKKSNSKRVNKQSHKPQENNQTQWITTSDVASNTDHFLIPSNKFEKLVEESCNRLERCLVKATNSEQNSRHWEANEQLHRFPQPFGAWNLGNMVDDSSTESNPAYSDYGSLPKRTRYVPRKNVNCTPSAFLKQLTTMRRRIVQDSKEELMKNTNNDDLQL